MTSPQPAPPTKRWEGKYGVAIEIQMTLPANDPGNVATWLLNSPRYHPAWSQWMLSSVRLADVPGWPPPNKWFPEATHEVVVLTLDPAHGPYTEENLLTRYVGPGPEQGKLPYLTPVSVMFQLKATDDEVSKTVRMLARSVVQLGLSPESEGNENHVRTTWGHLAQQSIEHLRGYHDTPGHPAHRHKGDTTS
jgi:hypothetical protein